jgi:hypothetical protein
LRVSYELTSISSSACDYNDHAGISVEYRGRDQKRCQLSSVSTRLRIWGSEVRILPGAPIISRIWLGAEIDQATWGKQRGKHLSWGEPWQNSSKVLPVNLAAALFDQLDDGSLEALVGVSQPIACHLEELIRTSPRHRRCEAGTSRCSSTTTIGMGA